MSKINHTWESEKTNSYILPEWVFSMYMEKPICAYALPYLMVKVWTKLYDDISNLDVDRYYHDIKVIRGRPSIVWKQRKPNKGRPPKYEYLQITAEVDDPKDDVRLWGITWRAHNLAKYLNEELRRDIYAYYFRHRRWKDKKPMEVIRFVFVIPWVGPEGRTLPNKLKFFTWLREITTKYLEGKIKELPPNKGEEILAQERVDLPHNSEDTFAGSIAKKSSQGAEDQDEKTVVMSKEDMMVLLKWLKMKLEEEKRNKEK